MLALQMSGSELSQTTKAGSSLGLLRTVMTGTAVHRVRQFRQGSMEPSATTEECPDVGAPLIHTETGAPVRPSEIERGGTSGNP